MRFVPSIILGFSCTSMALAQSARLSPAAQKSEAALTLLYHPKIENVAALKKALKMPGTPELLGSSDAPYHFLTIGLAFERWKGIDSSVYRTYAGLLRRIGHLRSWDGDYLPVITDVAKKAVSHPLAERVRQESIELIRRSLAKGDFVPKQAFGEPKVLLQGELDMLRGSGFRGTLVGNPAPTLSFIWCTDSDVKSLADLKGKIVVLDFWETWCKPCVLSMPKLRAAADAYAGKPVVFVSVTSLWGSIYDPKAGRIICKGNPQKEMSLMPGVMKELGMTWMGAFSSNTVFNPDFGVLGIPHITVIDKEGVVRYDDLEPEAVKSKLDALLGAH